MAKARVFLVLVLLSTAALAAPIEFRDCPYCHGVFAVTLDKGGHYVFSNHDFVKIAMGPGSYYETCSVTYFRYIGEAILTLRRISSGRVVEASPPARAEENHAGQTRVGQIEEGRTERAPAAVDTLSVRRPDMAQASSSRRD